MSNVLIIQNNRHEGPAYLGELLRNDGFKIHLINAKKEKIPNENFSLIVILGAPDSVNDDLSYLRDEEDLIRKSVSSNIPLLGICLGSQLIAKSFGAAVYAGKIKEIGFYNDLKLETKSDLFSNFENPFTVFHWHGETFDLPKNATRLASSSQYKNQAFQIGSAVGLQFHLEVNKDTVSTWLNNAKSELDKLPYIDQRKILNDLDRNILITTKNLEIFYKNLKSHFNL